MNYARNVVVLPYDSICYHKIGREASFSFLSVFLVLFGEQLGSIVAEQAVLQGGLGRAGGDLGSFSGLDVDIKGIAVLDGVSELGGFAVDEDVHDDAAGGWRRFEAYGYQGGADKCCLAFGAFVSTD